MTPEAYLDRVRDLIPDIRDRVGYAEELRRLPDETFKAFQEAGLFRAVQPKRYGGYELNRLFTATGGRAIFRHNPLQRAWRDVHAIRAHTANDLEKIVPIVGRIELDLPPGDLRF